MMTITMTLTIMKMLTFWPTLVQPVQKSSPKWWLVALASDTPTQHNYVLPERLLNMPQKVTADAYDCDNDIDHDEDVDNYDLH